jgi:hypothetical protein
VFAADVVACGEFQDLLAVDVGVEVKVKAFQRFGGVDGRTAQA